MREYQKTSSSIQSNRINRLLMTASLSTLALTANFGVTQSAWAQTAITDGNTITITSEADGEIITAGVGITSTVPDAPVVTIANNMVTVDNSGTLRTTGVTQTIQVNEDTSGAVINNNATGIIEADSRAINVVGDDVIVNNSGIIRGTGDQRNGVIYGNRTSNNLAINNTTTGIVDAGAGNAGAAIAIEVGGGGNPITGSITNAGTLQGRGQAAASGGTAGDGLRFFGPGLAPVYQYNGTITNSGTIASESTNGTTAGVRFANRINFGGTLTNEAGGTISGAQNGLYFGDADHTGGTVTNAGTISSDSRALNIDGTGLVVHNSGAIVGTGNQRNGTVYADSTAQGFTLYNAEDGVIDAGAGNEGAGFSAELSEVGNDFTIINAGTTQGRGQAGAGAATAGDGLRFERTRVGGALEGSTTGLFTGTITNRGTIDSEATTGTTAGIRFVNGVSFQGTLTNEESGVISGVNNGLYFGNPTPAGGGDHTGGVVNNAGTISSDSRALNIDGTGLVVHNSGSIVGTGNQRNGTVYADSTAQDFTLYNAEGGVIDAGAGNEGAGFSVELSEAGNDFTIINAGTIQGRGQAGAGAATAGDGLRFERTRVDGALEGSTTGLFTGSITNRGTIDSEATTGTTAGIRFVNGTSFQGALTNEAGGVISGVNNGLYFGNPTPAGGGDHTGGTVTNAGTISSDSRALNIDGTGLVVHNSGSIIGTGNQRNGTVYADSTAQGFTLYNAEGGVIDAGAGNEGAGFSTELSEAGNDFTIINAGTIQGRGQAGAGAATAGDGLRFERTRVGGALEGSTTGLFTGSITNRGTIDSEATAGTTAGIRFVNGVSFQGTLTNEVGGVISGVNNGLYFGNPTPAGGGDHIGGVVNNAGTISSDSRALNIDGTGLVVNNTGSILGTGNQRNGTVYADGTSNNFTLNNSGTIDAGIGNQGSGVAYQLGTADGDVRTLSFANSGTIAGRGVALGSGATAGLRLFNGAGAGTTVTVNGDLNNSGDISSETSAAILIENVALNGTINNSGTLSGASAFDASSALSAVNFVQSGGSLVGDFIGSSFADTLTVSEGSTTLNGNISSNVNLTVDAGASVNVVGARTLDGNLTSNGTLAFTLGEDSLAVDGDTTFGAGSVVNITADVSTALNTPISVITETGTFTNNGLTVNVIEDDFLVDYNVELGSVTVTATAADLAAVSTDANVSAFGGAISSAFAAGQLSADATTLLNGLSNSAEFEATSVSLLPSINEGAAREVYEAQTQANGLVQSRLRGGEGVGAWGQATYRTADRDAESTSVTGYDADTFSLTFGLDKKVSDNVIVGAAFTYADIEVEQEGGASEETDISSYQISGYAGLNNGPVYVNGQIGYVFSSAESERNAGLGVTSGEFNLDGLFLQGTAGYDFENEGYRITPQLGLRYASLSGDDYTETGGLGLTVDRDSVDFFEGRAGIEIGTTVKGSQGWTLQPTGKFGYVYDFTGDSTDFQITFPGATPFGLTNGDSAQSRFEYGLGLNLVNGSGMSIGIAYEGETASGYTSNSGFIRAKVSF